MAQTHLFDDAGCIITFLVRQIRYCSTWRDSPCIQKLVHLLFVDSAVDSDQLQLVSFLQAVLLINLNESTWWSPSSPTADQKYHLMVVDRVKHKL